MLIHYKKKIIKCIFRRLCFADLKNIQRWGIINNILQMSAKLPLIFICFLVPFCYAGPESCSVPFKATLALLYKECRRYAQ
jgi:hypothetical protein